MFLNIQSRWTAFLTHFCISAAIAAIVLWITFKIWYPGALFEIVDIQYLVTLLIAVDVVLGPILTLIVFKRGKKSLKFDLATIACVQIVALVYGVSVLFQIRPAFIVFNEDKVFELVLADEVVEMNPDREPTDYSMSDIPWWGPEVVYSEFPEDDRAGEFLSLHVDTGVNFAQVIDFYERLNKKHTTIVNQYGRIYKGIVAINSYNCNNDKLLALKLIYDKSEYSLLYQSKSPQCYRAISLIDIKE